jgi:hypothetical protein
MSEREGQQVGRGGEGGACDVCVSLDEKMRQAGRDKSAQTDVRVLRYRHAPDCRGRRSQGSV